MTQSFTDKMTGYKATDTNMKCQYFQFKLGEWFEHAGEVKMCASGFHFCVHPSGPFCYYPANSRVFKIEAEQVLEVPIEAGADFKLVAKRIRLVEEITPGMKGNDKSNTGDRNTGDSNTGDSNTGDSNTGDSNTGYWNATNRSAGVFCSEEPKVISFDVQTKLTFDEYMEKYPIAEQLGNLLMQKEPIDFSSFKMLPGITKSKLAALHKKHLEAKEKKS